MIKKTYIIPGLLIFDIRYIRKTIHDDIWNMLWYMVCYISRQLYSLLQAAKVERRNLLGWSSKVPSFGNSPSSASQPGSSSSCALRSLSQVKSGAKYSKMPRPLSLRSPVAMCMISRQWREAPSSIISLREEERNHKFSRELHAVFTYWMHFGCGVCGTTACSWLIHI